MRGVSLGPDKRLAIPLKLEGSAGKGLAPGASFFARVIGRLPDGSYKFVARGFSFVARSDLPLTKGQVLPLLARAIGGGGIELSIIEEASRHKLPAFIGEGLKEGAEASRAFWALARSGVAVTKKHSSALARILDRIASLKSEDRTDDAEEILEKLEAYLERGMIPRASAFNASSGGDNGGQRERRQGNAEAKDVFILPSGEANADSLVGTLKPSFEEGWWIRLPFRYEGADIELKGDLRVYLSGNPPSARKVVAEFSWSGDPFVAELPLAEDETMILRHAKPERLPPLDALADALKALGFGARIDTSILAEQPEPCPVPRVDLFA